MAEMGNPPDPVTMIDLGFVVDWQLSEGDTPLIDLSRADDEVVLPEDTRIESRPAR